MRCACPNCGVYMVHAEDLISGCICPNCRSRCNACLGTDSILTKDDLKQLADRPWFDTEPREEEYEENWED
ncbi:MAG: hypothetical protein E7332_03645 [Clostridiales bacterium]|nr:hypothetical protein [Clostridiales bacterium]MBP3940119.1 hypothetical protein [Christensenellaceae bacterium]MBR2223518.1 hypothetical protein [Christensenellaceae bacterium]MBR3843231.1 hypothetical protein [Christensenellaceae bacterium]